MAFCTVNFRGDSIGKYNGMHVILPDGEGPFPVLYLLHGLSDDYTIWQRRTSIERYVASVPLIVVMPDAHRSFYCNNSRPGGLRYEDYIYKDVVEFIDHTFDTIADRRGRALAGASMGGYGATMLAMKHPDVFSAAVSHSGALDFAHKDTGLKDVDEFAPVVPKREYDCYAMAKKVRAGRLKVAYRLDCGSGDILIDDTRDFHAYLDRIGYKHEYAEHPGGHKWEYWDEHIRDTIQFVMKHLKAK